MCMISIASVWEPGMAPEGHHCIHAYTMEPFEAGSWGGAVWDFRGGAGGVLGVVGYMV